MRFRSPLYISTAVALVIFACGGPILQNRNNSRLTDYVDPFIGTAFHGHTFPGATLPFGMVQLSPDTRLIGWDACAGYHYSDESIIGFSHTHLSGTGIGDYGDILFMPFIGDVPLDSGAYDNPDSGYRSRFSHETEHAEPGYYSVELSDYNVNVELTATTRAGLHRYTYPKAEDAGILIDLVPTIHGHQNPLHEIRILNKQEIQGLKVTSGWAKNHYVYFTAKFSKPFEAELYMDNVRQEGVSEISGQNAKVKLNFPTANGEEVLVKVGISATGYEGSAKNLNQEVSGWDFDGLRQKASEAWEEELSKVRVESDDLAEKRTFYTALYHSMIYPGMYSDRHRSRR